MGIVPLSVERLPRLLKIIDKQLAPEDEVIVVDGASLAESSDVAARHARTVVICTAKECRQQRI